MKKFRKIILAGAMFLLPCGLTFAQSSTQTSARQRAISDLKQVAYAGDVQAQVQLGLIYLTGDGVAKDDAEAMKWLRKAADQDDPAAERYLAEMYFKGRGAPVDDAEAAKWLHMAADQGDAQSQHNLAVLYVQGLGVPRNLKEAANWMRKSADQNLTAGLLGMGVLYENGDGVPEDHIEAAKWYQKAIDQGDVSAMNNLALLMATSRNATVRNPQAAIALANKLVASSNNPAYLDTLAAAYFANGQNDMAVAAEQKALARDPKNASYQKALEKYLAAAHAGR
ncbi:MAG TPA: tetratricopeptide repeat protein [Candidatus Dormibacteraeota bacterium]|nr:tetratricopeptide repeat protein [Candidatus Dormibacteraeota bacterium]